MIYLLALFLPFVALLVKRRWIGAVVLFVLQLTLIGWIPAFIIAAIIIHGIHADARTQRIVDAVEANRKEPVTSNG